jgi:hypothetical protein
VQLIDSKADYCRAKALEYTRRAEEASDQVTREFLYRMRDTWISAANRQEKLDGAKK